LTPEGPLQKPGKFTSAELKSDERDISR
jgi:hypothetical protein